MLCVSQGEALIETVAVDQLVYEDPLKACSIYAVVALYADGESQYAYAESPQPLEINAPVMIPDYSEVSAPFQLAQFGNNGSGITWHENLQQFLVVQNSAGVIYRYDEQFNYLGQIIRRGNMASDMEGLGYVEGNQVMVVTEVNVAHKAVIDAETTAISGNYDVTPGYRLLPTPVSNKGLEAVTVRPATSGQPARVYACQEGTRSNSAALMRLVYFDMLSPDPQVLISYNARLTVIEPFSAEEAFTGIITDCSGMVYDPRSGHLIIVSQESSKAIQIDPESGEIKFELFLSGAP